MNALRVALRIISGKIIFISRLSRPAGRSKRIFTSGVAERTRNAFLIVELLKYFHYKPKPPCKGLRGGFGHRKENNMKKQRKSGQPMVTCTVTSVPAAASGRTLPEMALPSTVTALMPCCTPAALSTVMW